MKYLGLTQILAFTLPWLLALFACSSTIAEDEKPGNNSLNAGGTGTDKVEGFVELLVGGDLKQHFETTGNWMLSEEGVAQLQSREGDTGWKRYGDYLWLKKQYGDFECEFEYRHKKGGNSGFYFNVTDRQRAVGSVIEVQIKDSFGESELSAHATCGGILPGIAPKANTAKPAGQWNKMAISSRNGEITVKLNGVLVNRANLTHSLLKSKRKQGFIGFQDHGIPFWLRNMRIRDVSSSNSVSESPRLASQSQKEIHLVQDRSESIVGGLDGFATPAKQPDAQEQAVAFQLIGKSDAQQTLRSAIPAEYDAVAVRDLLTSAQSHGDPSRGVMVFGSEKFACVSCHKVGDQGGTVGPDLTTIRNRQTPEQIVESLLWPNRHVKPEHQTVIVVTVDGKLAKGYKVSEDAETLVLRDPSSAALIEIDKDDIEERRQGGSLMPAGVVSAMTVAQRRDLVRLLVSLGAEDSPPLETITTLLMHAQAHRHGPATFKFDRAPLHPEDWPSWKEHVNRERVYDFYAKQADHFRQQTHCPPLLQGYTGLDGGEQGHWGNQNSKTWADGRWKQTDMGSVQCGRIRAGKLQITRGVCLKLGDDLSVCFNPDTLCYEAVWTGGFLTPTSKRHGLIDALAIQGELGRRPQGKKPEVPFDYHGFYRHGRRVIFSYRIGDEEYLDVPSVRDGQFHRLVAPADEHPLRYLTEGGPSQWPQGFQTEIKTGAAKPYAIDRIGLPVENPWKALIYCAGHDFLPDGSAVVCTFQGDVWHVSNFAGTSDRATWRRYASGLSQAMGIITVGNDVYVQGRDQLTRLRDLNDDGEADFYECFSNAMESLFAGHSFICGLERDAEGNFYTASDNQGLVRISPDGRRADVLATGFRNPDGLGLMPNGTLTVPSSEGDWTPASMISAVDSSAPNSLRSPESASSIPHFGHRGPTSKGVPPNLPLVYLPRALDNSSGGQVFVSSDRWGPLKGQLIHFSYGRGTHFLILQDKVGDWLQGAAVPLRGEFRSGAHRGRFSPHDGQLYVTGMIGWGTYTLDDGCFERVRYTGGEAQFPIGFHVHENGVMLEFDEPIDPAIAEKTTNHFAQCWNYRYSPAYGSPEFSSRHMRTLGHDVLEIRSAHVLADRHKLFLEILDLQPVNQLHLYVHVDDSDPQELFVTVHKLAAPFTGFPGYQLTKKTIAPHPMLADMASLGKGVENPWRKKIANARDIRLETGKNLSFARRSFRVKAGEPIKFTLVNPDVVPHNWVLVNSGSMESVGKLSNHLVADPDAFAKHYIPESDDVLVYTNVVEPRSEFTVYFCAPETPGRYPYLCTFPGHWMVMNGVMIVDEP